MADRSNLDARPVIAHGIFHAALDGIAVLVLFHIDEIDDDQTGQVAQAQLAAQLVSGFQIGLQRGFLDIAFARRAAGIDIHRDKRLCLVDHQIPARFQRNLRAVDGVHLLFRLIALEDRQAVLIFLHLLHMAGDQHFHLCPRGLVSLFAFDQHLVHLAGIEIADGPFNQVPFLVDYAGGL